MIEIRERRNNLTVCTNCIHNHVCKFKEEYMQFVQQPVPDFAYISVECRSYKPITLDPIKIN